MPDRGRVVRPGRGRATRRRVVHGRRLVERTFADHGDRGRAAVLGNRRGRVREPQHRNRPQREAVERCRGRRPDGACADDRGRTGQQIESVERGLGATHRLKCRIWDAGAALDVESDDLGRREPERADGVERRRCSAGSASRGRRCPSRCRTASWSLCHRCCSYTRSPRQPGRHPGSGRPQRTRGRRRPGRPAVHRVAIHLLPVVRVEAEVVVVGIARRHSCRIVDGADPVDLWVEVEPERRGRARERSNVRRRDSRGGPVARERGGRIQDVDRSLARLSEQVAAARAVVDADQVRCR